MEIAMSDEETKVVLIRENWRESAARDVGTFVLIASLWSLGWYAGSSALEWIGVIFALVLILCRATTIFKKRRMTPDEARAWLDREFPR